MKMSAPTLVLDMPDSVKELPQSLFPKPQTVTKSPTNASIAPRASFQGYYHFRVGLLHFKVFAYLGELT